MTPVPPRRPVLHAHLASLPLLASLVGLALLSGGRGTGGAARDPEYGWPDLAQRHAVAKRLPLDRTVDTRAAYRRARRHVADMPAYSTPLGRRIGGRERASREIRGKWKSLGPGNIGGRMRTLVIDPTHPDTMLVGGVSGGVWRTRDAGRSWEPVGDSLQNVAVNAMALDPVDPETVYVGTGEGYFREDVRGTGLPLRGGGIFRSRDGGDRWEMLAGTEGEDFWFVNDLAVSSRDREVLYAATRTGVWRSRDGGSSWSRTLATDVQGGCLDLALRTDRTEDVLFAACGTFERSTVYRSEDAAAGDAWEAVLSEPDMGRTSLALAPSDQSVVYALAASNAPGPYEQALHAVFRSADGGAPGTWEARVRNTAPQRHETLLLHNAVYGVYAACGFGDEDSFLPMGWYVNTIAVDPVDPDVVWAAGVDWFRSDDGGVSWGVASYWWGSRSTPSWAHADQHVLRFHPGYDGTSNQIVFIGNDGGIFRSDNARAEVAGGPTGLCSPLNSAVAWRSLNRGLEITQFYHGLPFPSGRAWLGGTQDNGTILRPRGRGVDGWQGLFGGDGGYVAIDPRDPDVLYLEYQGAELRKSTDGGRTFVDARNGLPPARFDLLGPDGEFLFITPFVMDPSDPDVLWTGGRRIFRTVDGAGLWEAASKKLRGRSRASAMAVAPGDSDRVAVGTDKGFLFVNRAAGRAGAATRWPSKRPRKAWVTWVTFDPTDPEVLYATYGGFGGPHVYRSDTGGRRWRSIDGTGAEGLPDVPVHTLVVDPEAPDRLFVGTDLGVFVTTDGGDSWAQEIAGFGNIVTESLSWQARGRRRFLYAFTHGRGAWKAKVKPAS